MERFDAFGTGEGPLGFGIGLRSEHYGDALADPGRADWYEAISENFMDSGGRPLHVLEAIRREAPLALHGVGLSIGSVDPLDRVYLERLRDLIRRIEPVLVTDHLCWTGVDRRPLYDLLPLPYTPEALEHVCRRIDAVQTFLARPIALENPSSYVAFQASSIPEWEFLAAIVRKTDCRILLDVNNVFVSARNLGFDAETYVDAIPADAIAQVHLAGHSDLGTFLFDTHSAPVCDAVWRLYERVVARVGTVPTLIEWDSEIPSFERVCEEADHARRLAAAIEDDDAATPRRASAA